MLIESSRDTWPLTKYPYGIAYLRYLYNDAFTAASIARLYNATPDAQSLRVPTSRVKRAA
jgi:hypothetical protein